MVILVYDSHYTGQLVFASSPSYPVRNEGFWWSPFIFADDKQHIRTVEFSSVKYTILLS